MKKMTYVSLTLLLSTSLLFPITTLADSTVTGESIVEGTTINTDRSDELKKFTNMQDKITSVLKIENGKYLYNENEVKSIINQFNFEELAQKTGIEYTKESFYEEAIENINETTFKPQIEGRNANRYNINKTQEGWNYTRVWFNTNNTNILIKELQDGADYVAGGGLLVDLFSGVAGLAGYVSGPLAGALMLSATVSGAGCILYFQNMARNVEYKNNGTGTVIEVNKYVALYSCWSQNEYKGK